MIEPLVSVVMPVYNGIQFIKESVQSILTQTLQDFELIIYDDGSTDGTQDYLKTLRESRVRVYFGDYHQNCPAARNFLLEKVLGKYVAHQDADDMAFPIRLESQLEFLRNNKNLVFTCCSNQVMHSKKVFKFETDPEQAPIKQYKLQKVFAGNTSFYSREVVDAGVRYDLTLEYGSDVLYEVEIQARFPFKMQAMDEVLVLYRKHENAITVRRRRVIISSHIMEKRNALIKELLYPIVKGKV
ncbi:MAG TPA: glycosyltransferase family 2 protein [bacterium]|nr:glycosyltransferase family 2 protein [bacterium]